MDCVSRVSLQDRFYSLCIPPYSKTDSRSTRDARGNLWRSLSVRGSYICSNLTSFLWAVNSRIPSSSTYAVNVLFYVAVYIFLDVSMSASNTMATTEISGGSPVNTIRDCRPPNPLTARWYGPGAARGDGEPERSTLHPSS